MIRSKWLFASLLLAVGTAQAATVEYKLDPNHTMVLASWDHGGYSRPTANFGQVDGTLVYDADKVAASSVEVTLPLSGLESFVPDFNEHLRSGPKPIHFGSWKCPNEKVCWLSSQPAFTLPRSAVGRATIISPPPRPWLRW